MTYFYIEKRGVYSHGVYWIGEDEDKGRKECDRLASKDSDDYHEWALHDYKVVDGESVVRLIYSASKQAKKEFLVCPDRIKKLKAHLTLTNSAD